MCAAVPSLAHLGGEVGHKEHDLILGAVERTLAVLEVEEDPHAGVDDLLERVGRRDLLATEARLLLRVSRLFGRF